MPREQMRKRKPPARSRGRTNLDVEGTGGAGDAGASRAGSAPIAAPRGAATRRTITIAPEAATPLRAAAARAILVGVGVARRACRAAQHAGFLMHADAERWMLSRVDASWPAHGLRVGLADGPGRDPSWRDEMVDAAGEVAVRWVLLPRAENGTRQGLDAVVTADADGGFSIATPEHRERSAAWHDWSAEAGAGYASVFPRRVDCRRVTLGRAGARPERLALLASLAECAAVFARTPARLTLEDRLAGRAAIDGADGVAHAAILRLTQRLAEAPLGGQLTVGERAAGRVAGAYLTGLEFSVEGEWRRSLMEMVVRANPREPETLMRLAAARYAAGDADGALDAVLHAEALLERAPARADGDQAAFLLSELRFGGGTRLAIGRAVAGIALLVAPVERDRLDYLRDDVLDEIRACECLESEDHHVLMISRVFDEVRRRRSGRQRRAA